MNLTSIICMDLSRSKHCLCWASPSHWLADNATEHYSAYLGSDSYDFAYLGSDSFGSAYLGSDSFGSAYFGSDSFGSAYFGSDSFGFAYFDWD